MSVVADTNALPPFRRTYIVYTTYDFERDYPNVQVNKVRVFCTRDAAEFFVNYVWHDNMPHSSATSTIVEDIVPW